MFPVWFDLFRAYIHSPFTAIIILDSLLEDLNGTTILTIEPLTLQPNILKSFLHLDKHQPLLLLFPFLPLFLWPFLPRKLKMIQPTLLYIIYQAIKYAGMTLDSLLWSYKIGRDDTRFSSSIYGSLMTYVFAFISSPETLSIGLLLEHIYELEP